jgi:uncharacterized protein YcbK (DUF882 family)
VRALYEVQLSHNFYGREFRCRGEEEGKPCSCHGALSVDRRLVTVLQALRELMGSPVHLTSAFRCDEFNAAVGGHKASFHRVGMAADVTSIQIRKDLRVIGPKLGEIVEDIIGKGKGNVIMYPNRGFLHVDCGHRVADKLVREK